MQNTGPWQVYLLECADHSLYCGITTDMARRLDQHNGLRPGGAKYTKGRRPVHLVTAASCPDRSTASRFEKIVQALPRHEKIAYLLTMQKQAFPEPTSLS